MRKRNGYDPRNALMYSAAPLSSYYFMHAPDDPPAPVEINIEAPETEDTDPPDDDEAEEALQEIGSRVTALEARVTEGLEGERTWNRTEISSLKTELADLKATLEQVTINLPAQIQAMREELTRRLQDVQAEVNQNEMPELEEMDPPEIPPEPESVEDTQIPAPAPAAPRSEAVKRRNRIV